MAAFPHIGFDYVPGLSTAGILYNGENELPRFSSRLGLTHSPILPQGMGHPINICSSSTGLIACHNPITNIYYIGNPDYPDTYIPLPQPPRQHNPYYTNVVLATEFSPQPIYHLICAVLESLGPTRYTFDTYSSYIGSWFSYSGIDVGHGGYIIPNTGVSCGSFAYWLTDSPLSMIHFDVYHPQWRWQVLLDNDFLCAPEARFQLGRVGNHLGLVSVDGSFCTRVSLSILEEHNPLRFMVQSGYLGIFNRHSIPRPIRFESSKIEVFFWANGRLLIWENISVNHRTTRVRWLNAEGAHAANGIAHVSTTFLPENFPLTIQFID